MNTQTCSRSVSEARFQTHRSRTGAWRQSFRYRNTIHLSVSKAPKLHCTKIVSKIPARHSKAFRTASRNTTDSRATQQPAKSMYMVYHGLVRGTQVLCEQPMRLIPTLHWSEGLRWCTVRKLDCLEIGPRGFRICLNHFVSRARLSTRGNVSRRERLRGNTHEKTSTKTF